MSIIIGIDHGYYAIKTAHCSFPAGLTSYGEHEPYTRQGLLEFGGCFFVCGSGRQPIQRDKTMNDNYYLLTLAAVAKEIQQRSLPPECSVRIAAGLPLTSFGRDKPRFKEYLLRSNQPVNFKFEGVEYSITIEEVAVFPQGYAALMTETGLLQDEPSMLLMDLGGWTVDRMRIDNAIPAADTAHSLELGMIRCVDDIREQVRRETGLSLTDAPCAFHPAPHVNKCFVPYIFTKDEIERLFSAVDCTKESSESPLRHLVMPVLFRLLYTCGLRVSEALHLKVADVDLDAGVLAIYGAKGDKERLVGISDSMLAYMKSYRSNPLVANAKSIYFFPAPDGGFYDTSTIYDIFRKCLFDAGIPHRGRGKGPRLHDLRHSFAVHILNKWSSEGKDIYTCLPILRTALGHDRITTTEKYLRLVPEAYMEVTEPFNDRFHTITEVLCNEE